MLSIKGISLFTHPQKFMYFFIQSKRNYVFFDEKSQDLYPYTELQWSYMKSGAAHHRPGEHLCVYKAYTCIKCSLNDQSFRQIRPLFIIWYRLYPFEAALKL